MAATATKDVRGGTPEQRKFTANVYREDEDYVAECVEIGTVGQGATFDEAVNDLREATELLLEEAPEVLNRPPRLRTTLEDGIRDLEEAFDRYSGEVAVPASFYHVGTAQFTVELTHA